MVSYAASRYSILIPLKQGRCLAYNSLSASFAIWEAAEYQTYEQIRSGDSAADPQILQDLEYGGYIVPEETDELEVLQQEYNGHRYDTRTMTLTIAPTMACNFGCDYCFQGQDKPNKSMGQDVQDAIVSLVERGAPKLRQVGVAWYGGEPLIRRPIIESLSDRLMAICQKNNLKYDAMVVTNGYLLDLEAARSLHKRRVHTIQVTLDGTPEYHDTRRYLLSKKGTFEKIIDNLKAIVDEVPIFLSIRVNIDDRNHSDIRALIDYMAEAGLGHKKNLKMYFAPVEAMTAGCHNVEDVTLSKFQYGQLEAELYRHGYTAGLTSLPFPPRFHGTCAAVRPKGLVILPTGDVHKCWDTVSWPERRVGSIFQVEDIPRHELSQKWLRWSPFRNETCRNCKLLPNCAGACAYKFVHADQTRGEAAVLPCPSWKYNIKERLLYRALAMNAITKDDYDPEAIRTDPSELCADVHVEGVALPEVMQHYYEKQKAPTKRRLPVISSVPEASGI